MCAIDCILFIIGLNVIISAIFELKTIISSLIAHKSITDYGQGSWALVTASTDGIGQGFAVSLAKQGFNIIQVGRNPEKLSATGNDLKSKYGIQVRNIVKNFSEGPKNPIEFYGDIYAQTKDLDISILVNNVGTSTGKRKFLDMPIEGLLNQLALNLFPISFMSRLFLPKLCSRPKGGAVINLSSVMAYTIMPNFIVYSSGKAFDQAISLVASSEIRKNKHGVEIDMLTLHPAYVDTPLTSNSKSKPLEISRYECAEAALRCVGIRSSTSAHPKHLVMTLFLKTLFVAASYLNISV